jgi:tetratricopeptide (TPR) repeat protein
MPGLISPQLDRPETVHAAVRTLSATVVAPTYREAENVADLIAAVAAVREASGIELELLFVDDDSGDGIERVVQECGRPWVRVMVRRSERGLASAALAGARAARHRTVVIMDADGSHPAAAIPAMIAELDRGAEIVLGSRFVLGGSTDAEWNAGRRFNSWLATRLARPFAAVRDPMSGFIAFRRELLERAPDMRPRGYKIGLELIVRSGALGVVEVPIAFRERRKGRSKLSLRVRGEYLVQLVGLGAFALGGRAGGAEVFMLPRRGGGEARGPGSPWRTVGVVACLVMLVAVVFGRVAGHGWLDYDDRFHVVDNPRMRAGAAEGTGAFWKGQYGNLYIPVAYDTLWAETQVARAVDGEAPGLWVRPRVFHVTSVGLHAAMVILIFAVLRRLGAYVTAAGLGAAVFAVHPFQAESVGWISEQRGLLAGVFSAAALLLYLEWREAGTDEGDGTARRPRWVPYGAAMLAFGLALLSKPSAAALPVMVAMIELWRGTRWRVIGTSMMPWIAMSAAIVLFTRALQPGSGVSEGAPLWARPLIAGDALAFYIEKLIWPFSMSPDYGRTPRVALEGWWVWVAWAVPVAVIAAAVLTAIRWRGTAAGQFARVALAAMGVMITALLPVLGLVTFDHQNISTVADRYMYLAMLGPALVVAWVAARGGLGVRVAIAVLVVALSARAFDQAGTWRDDRTLWSHSFSVSPRSATTLTNLGFALAKEGRHTEAIGLYERALAERPDLGLANINLAYSTMDAAGAAASLPLFERAVRVAPRDARAHLGQGVALARLGRVSEALACFTRAAELDPGSADAHGNLGLARMQAAELESARREFETALALNPDLGTVWFNYGLLLDGEGNAERAAEAWMRAVKLDPSLAAGWYRLGDAHARAGRLAEAERAYATALAADPTMADAANNLGLVYIRLGKTREAIAAFERALGANPAHPEARDNLAAAEKLRDRGK